MPKTTLITNVSVLTMSSDKVLPGQDVTINDSRIEDISKSQPQHRTSDTVIDGRGKYLMPGLFDMHAHINDKKFLPLFLMNGVTAVRDLGNVDDGIFQLKKDAQDGTVLSPRLFVSGKILEGDPPFWDGFKVIKSAAGAVAAVRKLKQKGADFVKVYHTLQPNLYHAILEEAKKQNLPVTGHIPYDMTPVEALDSGQIGIEHISSISGFAGEILMEDADEAGYEGWSRFTGYKINETAFQKLLVTLQKHKAYICPTLVVDQKISGLADYASLAALPEAAYMEDKYVKEEWNPSHRNAAANIKDVRPLWFKNYGVIYKGSKQLIPRLAEHATILAGTDTPNPFVIPGFSLLDELELLVESGLSAFQALQAATTNAAQCLGVSDELGNVEVGKLATLVLLSKNPLESIANIKSTAGVLLNGQYHLVDDLKRLIKK